jgi:micrococcal nuclease
MRAIGTVIAVMVGGLAAFAPALAAEVEVIAADIVRADGKEWRIANVEAPQLDAECAAEKAYEAKARAKLAQILADGKVDIKPTGGHDIQGRDTARLRVNGRDVGEAMIYEGMAGPRGHGRPFCVASADDFSFGRRRGQRPDSSAGIGQAQQRPRSTPPAPGVGIRR